MTDSRMEKGDGALREPLLQNQEDPSTPETHLFTFANGVTRSVSRRDEVISCKPEWIFGEVRKQLWLAAPMVCVAFMNYLVVVVSVMFVGHLGELELASASIATSFIGMTGTSFLIGMAAALETLCGQAYGAKQYHMLGIYTQRAMFVLYLMCIPIALTWWNMGSLLMFLGQDPQISEMAGIYARHMIPVAFAVASLQPLVKFLQTQSIALPMAALSAGTLILHIPLCWLLIFKLGIGYRGAAIASSVSNWFNVIVLALYVKFSPSCKKTWTSFSWKALNDLSSFFKLAIPSALMICLEFWSFEALVLFSGLLPNPRLETSTLSICLTSTALLYMTPFGIGAAASTRVGNELGAGRPQAARGAVTIAVSMGLTEGISTAMIMYAGRFLWGKAYTHEQDVIDYVAKCTPLLAIIHLMDSMQGVLNGVARGCGWQAYGAATNFSAYYIVGLPAAVIFGFVYDLKGFGLWIGMVLGIVTQTSSLVIMTSLTNWQQQAEQALLRVGRDSANAAPLLIEANHAQEDESPSLHLFKYDDLEDRKS